MERADIQGLVLSGYGKWPYTRAYRLRFAGDARRWLSRALVDVTCAADSVHEPFRLNLALSASGLGALGLPESALATFPREFLQGMAHPERSNALGDVNEDAPEHWEFGGSGERRVDGLALLYAPEPGLLEERAAGVEQQLERFGVGFEFEDIRLPADRREHFGFATGISEPHVRGSGRRRPPGERRIAAGEFVLGYANSYGTRPASPRAPEKRGTRALPDPVLGTGQVDFGRNGTFLVLRKLEQRVAAFWRFARRAALELGEPDLERGAELCAARLIGRWPNGAPLVLSPEVDALPNAGLCEFSFRYDDPLGHKCPLGAHLRRANPRDMLGGEARRARSEVSRHRILRRGRIYGPKPKERELDDGAARGLYFMALNADIRRQFEFVQQNWINGSRFGGLRGERDPLLGKDSKPEGAESAARVFTVQADPIRHRLTDLERFVLVRGGEYFFLPGLRALNYLAEP